MKLLELEQNSAIEYQAKLKWDAKLKRVLSEPFDSMAERFPSNLIEINDLNAHPKWGHAWYKRTEDNMLELFKENWDTSG